MDINFKEKYGPVALVAGASEGLGAAYSIALAAKGMDVILIARRSVPLENTGSYIREFYGVNVTTISCDLSESDAMQHIRASLGEVEVNFLVYNAALSYIGPFLQLNPEEHEKIVTVNCLAPMKMVFEFGSRMIEKGKGGIVLMSSLAGFQGSGFLTTYAASKAFNRILGEGLWYEWKKKGVDVIACCAGATATPGYINSNPKKPSMFAPKIQQPEEVVEECLQKIGKVPSFAAGSGNKIATFFMSRVFSRKQAINIMGNTTRKMYRIEY